MNANKKKVPPMIPRLWTSFQYAPELNPNVDKMTAPGTYEMKVRAKKGTSQKRDTFKYCVQT
jgi:hypothetical protein